MVSERGYVWDVGWAVVVVVEVVVELGEEACWGWGGTWGRTGAKRALARRRGRGRGRGRGTVGGAAAGGVTRLVVVTPMALAFSRSVAPACAQRPWPAPSSRPPELNLKKRVEWVCGWMGGWGAMAGGGGDYAVENRAKQVSEMKFAIGTLRPGISQAR